MRSRSNPTEPSDDAEPDPWDVAEPEPSDDAEPDPWDVAEPEPSDDEEPELPSNDAESDRTANSAPLTRRNSNKVHEIKTHIVSLFAEHEPVSDRIDDI
jgi:hypothetical protein